MLLRREVDGARESAEEVSLAHVKNILRRFNGQLRFSSGGVIFNPCEPHMRQRNGSCASSQ